MTFLEKGNRVVLVVAVPTLLGYGAVVAPQVLGKPMAEVSWIQPMIFAIVGFVVANVLGNVVAAASNPGEADKNDERDREIDQFGERVGNWLLVAGSIAALVLTLAEFDYFWIANAITSRSWPGGGRRRGRQARRLSTGLLGRWCKPTRVSNQIRRLRFEAGEMTQAELAERVGVTRQTIIAIEQGRYSPSLEMAFQIAQVIRRDRSTTSSVRATRRRHVMTTPTTTRSRSGSGADSRRAGSSAPFWMVHRAIYRLTRRPDRPAPRRRPTRWGMMRLTTVGRRSRQRAARHPRLLRGRAEPGHHGHERLGRRRARLVAQPAGKPGHHGRAGRRPARGPRPCGRHRTSGPACGRAGPSTTARRRSTAGQRGDRARPRSSSCPRPEAQAGVGAKNGSK